ncbi:hypothetical protein [Bradyrhizobium sp. dw_78]|uniref:hypothetical protein n=1 Tax=Bradyrhizobium sp. dw_78 TaxID=2719793 RepID=UPI001BD497E3|nr:hypothetical protein [Bradyrhizobium sp. dw_78]
MRISDMIFVGSVAALAALAAPALAKNSDAQKSDDTSASPACHAYQPAADGSWTQVPCQEVGAGSPTPRKSAASTPEEDTRGHHQVR